MSKYNKTFLVKLIEGKWTVFDELPPKEGVILFTGVSGGGGNAGQNHPLDFYTVQAETDEAAVNLIVEFLKKPHW